MENTKLNDKMDEFLESPLNDIDAEKIGKYFSESDFDKYGFCLHALVQKKYDEEKVFKFLDEFISLNRYNINFSTKLTGYTFIHLALYGYTDIQNTDHSYSTNFIIKLIEIAKKDARFNVNCVDNDGDSYIHTALASEIYTGEVLPIIKALGDEFDLSCRDGNMLNIYEALLKYKEEARINKNKQWYDRLSKEETEIKKIIYNPNNSYKLNNKGIFNYEKTWMNDCMNILFEKKIDEINIETINNIFNNGIKCLTKYGNRLHAAIQMKYDDDKILKFLEVCVNNKFNFNRIGDLTGHTFIHSALYGYITEFNYQKRYSYSTDFIVKIINIAKKNKKFDVNNKDYDGDSYVHAALASSIYTGEVIPIIESLGSNFDLSCRDKDGLNIYEALLKYKEEARINKNKQWYDRLSKEEVEIKELVYNKKINKITDKLNELFDELTLEKLSVKSDEILELKSKLLKIMPLEDFNNLWNEYDSKIKKNFFDRNFDNLEELKITNNIFKKFGYTEEVKKISDYITGYSKKMKKLKFEIANIKNLILLDNIDLSLLMKDDQDILYKLILEKKKQILKEELINNCKADIGRIINKNILLLNSTGMFSKEQVEEIINTIISEEIIKLFSSEEESEKQKVK